MMLVRITHRLDVAGMRRLIGSPEGGIYRDMYRRGERVAGMAKQRCPVDHGRLRSSIHTRMIKRNGTYLVEIGTNVKYALWVHEGTGLYGPRHARIYPKRGKYMVFKPRVAGGRLIPAKNRTTVFARSTRGMRGTPFLRMALPAAVG